MKNRTFYATFLLFLLTIYTGIFILSLITLRDTTSRAKEQCLNEQYFISSALYSDLAALENRDVNAGTEMETLMQPYLYLTGNRKSLLAVYQNGRLLHTTSLQPDLELPPAHNPAGTRSVTIDQNGVRFLCSVSGALPEPFDSYQVFYQADITDRIDAWKYRNNTMLAAGGIVSLMLALFLLILLGRLFRPLSKITQLSRKIAAGDYTVRLPDKGRDEIAQMARSFNDMASVIENKITELAAAAENRQRFVDNFAHELRTPLTAIYGYAEYMQKAALSEEDSRFALESILSESRRMQLMANQLMELSHLRSGEIRMEKQNLFNILDSVKCAMKQKLEERDIQLRISSQVETVTGDTILLQSLLVNLIDNAVKASGAGTVISVDTFYQDGKPVVTVADQGKGMEPAELTRITEPYYRVDKPRNRREGGAGLGLALCQQIAAVHGAALSFQSTPGQGTTATVIFTSRNTSMITPQHPASILCIVITQYKKGALNMNTSTHKSGFVKALLAAALTVGAVTIAFQGLAQVVLAAETGKEEKIITSYSTNALLAPSENKSNVPDGYVKQAYTLVDNNLEYYRDKKPTSLDLTREEAAEIGVQGLYQVFGLDMGGKSIEMAYNPAADELRATWDGVWWVNGHKRSGESYAQSYSFSVDAISGELHSVLHDRVLDGQTNTGFDTKLHQDAKEFEALAREQAIKIGAIQGNVKTVEYAGQGATNNDPEIFFDITGENGKRARLQFSRYDKELVAAVYDAGVRRMDVSSKNADDFAKRAEAYFRQHPEATSFEE